MTLTDPAIDNQTKDDVESTQAIKAAFARNIEPGLGDDANQDDQMEGKMDEQRDERLRDERLKEQMEAQMEEQMEERLDDHHDFIKTGVATTKEIKGTDDINPAEPTSAPEAQTLNLDDDSIIINPFFVGMNGGSTMTIPKRDFFTTYSYCFALLLRKDVTIDSNMTKQIYQKVHPVSELRKLCASFRLVKVDIKLLHNIRFKKVSNLIDSRILTALFGNEHDFQDEEMVVPLFNLNESDALNYLSLYRVTQSIDDLASVLSSVNVFNSDYTVPIDSAIEALLQNIDPRTFWSHAKNCHFPLFTIFDERSFSYNGVRLDKIRSEVLAGAKNISQLIERVHTKSDHKVTLAPEKASKIAKRNTQFNTFDGYRAMDEDVAENTGEGSTKMVTKTPKIEGQPTDNNSVDSANSTGSNGSNQHAPPQFTKSEHQNLYKILRNQKDRTFYVNNDTLSVTKDDIASIFDRITNEKYRFKLFNTLMVSKEYCHLVINNKRVLERNADLFSKYRAFYSYAMSYAWITFYLEESILSTKSNKYQRHTFDLETAHSLPSFPFSKMDLRQSPYSTILLPDSVIDSATNLVGLHSPHDHEKYHGLASPEEAKRRLNIFGSGHPDRDIFDIKGVDKSIFSISGSVMPACLQKMTPLFEKCTGPEIDETTRWNTYFKHFYGESDIDLMCRCKSVSELIMYGSKFIEHICSILNIERTDLTIKPDKKSAIIVSKHFFVECLDDVNDAIGDEYTVQELINLFENSDHADYVDIFEQLTQDYFYADYTAQKSAKNVEWRRSKKESGIKFDSELERSFTKFTPFKDFDIKMVTYDMPEAKQEKRDTEIYFFINDFRDDENKVPPEENYLVFKYSESLKFKIHSDKMTRPVEIFKVGDYDPFNTVARFHLPCVRAYYQSGKFYMLPSFITAMHTGINVDYKYFAGSRDPANICQKYLSRGYGMILNASEKKGMLTYSKAVDEYNGMYRATKAEDIFGPHELDHNYFCPGVFKMGLDKGVYNDPGTEFARTAADIQRAYATAGYDVTNEDCMINMLKVRAIGKDGNINPYKSWIADAFYDYAQGTQ